MHLEVIGHCERAAGGGELHKAVTVIPGDRKAIRVERGVESPVGHKQIDVSRRVGGRSGTRHPHGPLASVGGEIENADLLQAGFAITHDPSVIRRLIAVRRPSHVNRAVEQQQGSTFSVGSRVERQTAGQVGEGSLDGAGAAILFRTRGEVESMQPLIIIPVRILRHGHQENRAVWTHIEIDDRGRGDANLRRQ